MPEINPVPWDVFRPTMRVVMCPALPYPLIFTSKNLFPEQKQKTSSTCSYSHFPPCYTIPKMYLFGIHPCTLCPLCIVAVAMFAVFVALCPALPCLAFDACLWPAFGCRKRTTGGEGRHRRVELPRTKIIASYCAHLCEY